MMGTQVRDRGVVSSFIGSRQIDFFNGRTFRIQIRSPLHPLTLEGRRRTEDEVDGREDRARGQHSPAKVDPRSGFRRRFLPLTPLLSVVSLLILSLIVKYALKSD